MAIRIQHRRGSSTKIASYTPKAGEILVDTTKKALIFSPADGEKIELSQGGGSATLPSGGFVGQVLTKASNADNDVQWASTGAGGALIQTDVDVAAATPDSPYALLVSIPFGINYKLMQANVLREISEIIITDVVLALNSIMRQLYTLSNDDGTSFTTSSMVVNNLKTFTSTGDIDLSQFNKYEDWKLQ